MSRLDTPSPIATPYSGGNPVVTAEIAAITRSYPGSTVTPLRQEDANSQGVGNGLYRVETALKETLIAKAIPVTNHYGRRSSTYFRQEDILNKLDHHGVHKLLKSEISDVGSQILFFEYIEGESLRERLKRGPVSVKELLPIIENLLETLVYFQTPSYHPALEVVVHRDIKPSNIILRKDTGLPVIIDLGIAVVVNDLDSHEEPKTQTTTVQGTRKYMAPENSWLSPGINSDLYSLGVMLLELLQGSFPKGLESNSSPLRSREYLIPDSFKVQLDENTSSVNIPTPLQKFLGNLIKCDPNQRTSCAEEALKSFKKMQQELVRAGSGLEQSVPSSPVISESDLTQRLLSCHSLSASRTKDPQVSSGNSSTGDTLNQLDERTALNKVSVTLHKIAKSYPLSGIETNSAWENLREKARSGTLSVPLIESYLSGNLDAPTCSSLNDLVTRYSPTLSYEAIKMERDVYDNRPLELFPERGGIPAWVDREWGEKLQLTNKLCKVQQTLEEQKTLEGNICSLIVGAVATSRGIEGLAYLERRHTAYRGFREYQGEQARKRLNHADTEHIQALLSVSGGRFFFAETTLDGTVICISMPDGETRFLHSEWPDRHRGWVTFTSFEELQTYARKELGRGLVPLDFKETSTPNLSVLKPALELEALVHSEEPGSWLDSLIQERLALDKREDIRFRRLELWRDRTFEFTDPISCIKRTITLKDLVKIVPSTGILDCRERRMWFDNPESVVISDDGCVFTRIYYHPTGQPLFNDQALLPYARLFFINNALRVTPFKQLEKSLIPPTPKAPSTILQRAWRAISPLANNVVEAMHFIEKLDAIKRDALAVFQIRTSFESNVGEKHYNLLVSPEKFKAYLCPSGDLFVINDASSVICKLASSFLDNDDPASQYGRVELDLTDRRVKGDVEECFNRTAFRDLKPTDYKRWRNEARKMLRRAK